MDEMQKGKYEFMIKKHNMYMYIHTHIYYYIFRRENIDVERTTLYLETEYLSL